MKIQKLPAEVRCKLQSGMVVTDAVQCVKELVHNSLDAEATSIAVRIDLETYQIWVIDNGKGIKKDDLEFVGERYMTTKYNSFVDLKTTFPTYGFRGQALSCLQDVSKSLTIETKTEDEGPTFVKVFKNNNASSIIEIDNDNGKSGTGTTITIEDFMYTMPVRRKRINEVFDLEEIKNQLQYLAIIHYNVCFTLRNENKGLILLQTTQASNILESLSNIFGKTLAKSLKALDYNENKFEVSGFISLKPYTQNNVQLLYLNKRIVSKGIIHKFINNTIKEYRGKKNLFSDPFELQIQKTLKMSSYNAYIVQIKCPHSYYELFTNIRKTTVEFKNWKDVLKCTHKAIKKAFKEALNLDFSSCSQHPDDKNKAIINKSSKKVLGTSFLVNAVKGAPAKRGLNTKTNVKKRKRLKTNNGREKSDAVYLTEYENRNNCKQVDSLNSNNAQKECANDSLESPIPKKKFNLKMEYNLKFKETPAFSQSFVEFYEWLKTNFESDINAFNLYQDFLQFKNKTNHLKEVLETKSPVLCRRLKKKQGSGLSKKRLEKNHNKISSDFPVLVEEMADMTQKQLKIFPSGHLKLKKALQFTSEMKNAFSETLNLSRIIGKNLIFEKDNGQPTFKKFENLQISCRNQKEIDYNQSLLSLPTSEAQFTNIIKFRNLSESFFQQPSFTYNEIPIGKTFGSAALNSWASHYQNFIPANEELCQKRYSKENYTSQMEFNEGNVSEGRKIMKYMNFYDSDRSLVLVDSSNKEKEANAMRDKEIQVSLTETAIPVQKSNAFVQTDKIIYESPSFESSSAISQVNGVNIPKNAEVSFLKQQVLEKKLSQEVPNPDFWNTSGHIQFEAEFASNMNELTTKNVATDLINEKHSTCSDFICGHKSHLNSNPQNEKSLSKETQTFAAIWSDSLTKLGSPFENIEPHTLIISKSKLDNTSSLPKTLLAEEIECDNTQNVETGFYLTKRCDIVPKGLSPKFLNPETAPISILSPREKSKVKLTIDNAQNDLLAIIKWQDESTGDLLKPKIPDGIFLEMRQRAGETAINYENPVLSASLSYYATKIHNLLHSFAFTKELLTGVEILGQLDKKFIVTKMKIPAPKKMELLSLFDQHAVDERIKLEELLKRHISPDGKFLSSCLKLPVECFLTDSAVRVISNLKEKMFNFGFDFKLVDENTILINAIPTFLLNKHEKDLKNKKETPLPELLKSLIVNIIEEVTDTRGAVSKIPKIIHNVFCLEACHKAIRFNKTLSMDSMTEMINKLQNCTLPFQCAHGRPSVIPIIDLEDFKPTMEVNDKIDFQEFKRFLNERKLSIMENSQTALSKKSD